MAYRIRQKKLLPKEVRRIALEQLDSALNDLENSSENDLKGIHKARKRFKKLRGLFRLVRYEDGVNYSPENKSFRDMGRKLAVFRESEALLEIWQALEKRFPELKEPAFSPVYEALVSQRNQFATNEEYLKNSVAQVKEELQSARSRIDAWSLKRSFGSVRPGLKKIYKQGLKKFEKARNKPSDENFHEWRKYAKYHWYHLRLLENLWPPVFKGFRKSLKLLSDLLGDDHDLKDMKNFLDNNALELEQNEQDGQNEQIVIQLRQMIDQYQQELRSEAEALGRRIYAEKPKAFIQRINAYWKAC